MPMRTTEFKLLKSYSLNIVQKLYETWKRREGNFHIWSVKFIGKVQIMLTSLLSRLSWVETRIEIQHDIQHLIVKKETFCHLTSLNVVHKLYETPQKKKKKQKRNKNKNSHIILSLQNAQNTWKLGLLERALTLCYLFLSLCFYTMSFFFSFFLFYSTKISLNNWDSLDD